MKTSRIASLRPSAAVSLLIAFSAATTLAAAGDAPLVTFSVGSHWEGGYGGSVTIRNRGESAMSSWSVEYGGGPEVGSLWNGVHALLGGGRSRISNASWNGSLAPGASVSVGFNGVGTMTNDVADCTVNGASAEVAYQLPDGWASGGSGGGGEAGGGGEGGGESGGGSSGGGGANLEPPIVRFTIGNVWSGGYGATISIENAGGAAIENWQLEFIGGPNVASLWNGTHSVANGVQTVVAPSWNPNIAGGASVSLGLTGNGTMTDDVSMCRVNGVDATIVYELPEGWAGGSAGGGEGGGESGGGAGGGSGGGESGGGEAGGGTGGGESGGGAGGGESGGGESGSGAGGGESGGGEAGGGSGGGESGGGESGGGANIEPPRVRFTVGNTWGGGYGATISIENAGSVAIENWSLTYRGGPDVASLWNGTYSQSGDLSTIGHSGWNAAIGAGSAVSVGFTGLGTMTDNVVECRVNGVEATVVYELPAGWSGGGSSGGGDGGGESGGSTGGSGGGESGGEGGGGSGGGESGGGSSGGIDPDGQYGGGGETGSSGESGPRFSCEGDLNRDFVVDDADLVLLAASLGESGEGLAADLDRNGLVDETDLAMLEALFGGMSREADRCVLRRVGHLRKAVLPRVDAAPQGHAHQLRVREHRCRRPCRPRRFLRGDRQGLSRRQLGAACSRQLQPVQQRPQDAVPAPQDAHLGRGLDLRAPLQRCRAHSAEPGGLRRELRRLHPAVRIRRSRSRLGVPGLGRPCEQRLPPAGRHELHAARRGDPGAA